MRRWLAACVGSGRSSAAVHLRMPLQQPTENLAPTATMPALQAQGLGHLAEAMEGSVPPKFQKMTEELCEVSLDI